MVRRTFVPEVPEGFEYRDWRVLYLSALGYGAKTIAKEMHISISSVKHSRQRLFSRFGVRCVPALITQAFLTGTLRAEMFKDSERILGTRE